MRCLGIFLRGEIILTCGFKTDEFNAKAERISGNRAKGFMSTKELIRKQRGKEGIATKALRHKALFLRINLE